MSGKCIVPPQFRSEKLLVRLAQSGDHRAIEHLLLHYDPLRAMIGSLKRRMDSEGRAADDLEGAARVAVLEALRKFRTDGGARFTTYAHYFIRGEMLKVVFPASERNPHEGGLAQISHVALEQDTTLDDEYRAGPEQLRLGNDPEYGAEDGYAQVCDVDRDACVRRFVSTLPHGQRSITTEVFWEGQTHSEVAARRGVSRPAVTRTLRRVYARAEKELAREQLDLAA
jgi:RNA polymerase sigma factor (sigma-70 family)